MNVAKTEQEQLSFYDAVLDLHSAAVARTSLQQVDLVVADTRVRLAFAGPALVHNFTLALAHLRAPEGEPFEPEVTFRLWDSASTGVAMVPPPWQWEHVGERGDIRGFASARIKTAYHYHDHSVSLYDDARRIGVFWIPGVAGLPYWTVASPLRTLFHWWMVSQGRQLIHGAAVTADGQALLMVGKGGVGKSSTALNALRGGLGFVGDDYVIVRPGPTPTVYSLYATAKLNPQDVDAYPEFHDHLYSQVVAEHEKAVVMLHSAFADRVCVSAPIAGMALPAVVAGEARFVGEYPHVVRHAATLTTMAQLPAAGDASYQLIAAVADSLDAYRLELGPDRTRLNEVVRQFLGDPGSRPAPHADRSFDAAVRPMLSIIVPTYNGAAFIPDVIASIAAQRYPSVEIIIVDDGSTDDTEAVVRGLPADVRYFKQENRGPAFARNRGIRDASGSYLAFMDVDDLFADGALLALMDVLMADPELDVAQGYSQVLELDPETGTYAYAGSPADAFPFSIASCVYRRRIFDRVGLFDTSLRFGEDRDWFGRLEEAGLKPRKLDAVTLIVRRHEHNMTRGKSLLELNTLRVFKLALDRKRRRAASEGEKS